MAGDLTADWLADRLIASDDFDFADEVVSLAIAFVGDERRVRTVDDMRAVLAELA